MKILPFIGDYCVLEIKDSDTSNGLNLVADDTTIVKLFDTKIAIFPKGPYSTKDEILIAYISDVIIKVAEDSYTIYILHTTVDSKISLFVEGKLGDLDTKIIYMTMLDGKTEYSGVTFSLLKI